MTKEYTIYLWEILTDELLHEGDDVLDRLGINTYSNDDWMDEDFDNERTTTAGEQGGQ
jgi:hypothetical protein